MVAIDTFHNKAFHSSFLDRDFPDRFRILLKEKFIIEVSAGESDGKFERVTKIPPVQFEKMTTIFPD